MFEDKNSTKTPLESLGEFGLIRKLTQDVTLERASSIRGVGDDTAVVHHPDRHVLLTTDMLVEGVHFDLSYVPLPHLGYKAVVVNLSDLCAMNGIPTQITVSIAVSNRFPYEALAELYQGIRKACASYKVDLVGGDTTSSRSGMLISVSALGVAEPDRITYRHSARTGDLLVVSGDLGGAYLGLQVLLREKEVFLANPTHQPDLDPYTYIVERQLKPEARTDIVELLERLEVLPTAMIDISDGLSSEILHLCEASSIGCRLYEEKIPLDPTVIRTAEEFGIHPATCALNGGEDYELLFTIDPKDYSKIQGNPNLSVIGHMVDKEEGAHMVSSGGSLLPIQAQGWNSFQTDQEREA